VTKPFKVRPPELAALCLSLTVPSRRQARRVGKKFLRRCLHRRWSCSRVSCTVALLLLLLPVNASACCMASSRGAASSRDRRRKFPPLELWLGRAGRGSPRWDGMSSCRFSRSSKGGHPHLTRRHACRDPLHLGLVLLSVGRPRCCE
jgi:hypothetical protein